MRLEDYVNELICRHYIVDEEVSDLQAFGILGRFLQLTVQGRENNVVAHWQRIHGFCADMQVVVTFLLIRAILALCPQLTKL